MGKRKRKKDHYFAGVDIGGTKLHAIVADGKGNILARSRMKAKGEAGFKAVMGRVKSCIENACDEASLSLKKITAVGVGAPSAILPNGVAVNAPNMGWKNVPLTRQLKKALKRPVFALNDCEAGTLGEYQFGAGRKAKTLVGLFMGTGLGGGIIQRGRLLNGENSLAGELGHMVVERDGRECGCGGRGCLEAYASKLGMGHFIRHQVETEGKKSILEALCAAEYDNIRSGLLAKAYAAGDPVAIMALQEAANYLGLGVGNMITLFGPDTIVLGGGVMEALGKELIDRVRKEAEAVSFPRRSYADTKIRLAQLGDDAAAFGAVAWANAHTLALNAKH